MRSAKNLSLKLLSLAALLVGAASTVACGGGGAAPAGTTVSVDSPVLTPPPAPPPRPDPIPMPPDDGGGSPVDPVDPAPVDPPVEAPPEEHPVDVPPAVPAPELATVRAMALVNENALVADAAETYIGLYVADEAGGIWRRHESGEWRFLADIGSGITVEAMTYVEPKHALYLALATPTGQRLARFLLTPTPEVIDYSVDPPVVTDAGGVQFQMLANLSGEERLDGATSVTGLAFDRNLGRLYGWDHDARALFHLPDLDVAEAALDAVFHVSGAISLEDVQDMAFDRANGRMLLLDGASSAVIDLDHLGLAVFGVATLPSADYRALAWEETGMRLAVDRSSAAILRFDVTGAIL